MQAASDSDSSADDDDDGIRIDDGDPIGWIALWCIVALATFATAADAQDPTVGVVFITEDAFEGYTLFTPIGRDTTFLIDLDGRIVNFWPGEAIQMAYLGEDGTLLRTSNPGSDHFSVGGAHGTIERVDWDGNVIWSWTHSTDTTRLHHDFAPMSNGNILVNAYELKTMEDAHAAGADTSLYTEGAIYSEVILEIKPVGQSNAEIVWEWRLWDHLVQNYDETKPNFGEPAEHPERLDLNRAQRGGIADWIHFNTVTYNPRRDEIALSTPHFHEIYVIDHSTTTEEAAGHTGGQRGRGGDILYRWGNPAEYGMGAEGDRRLFFQHDVQWIKPGFRGEGNFILFNNRYGESVNERNHSTIDEFTPPLDADGNYIREPGEPFGPTELVYRYQDDPAFEMESRIISGVQRLRNGHTLICSGNRGNFIEIDENDEEVWRYRSPILTDGGYAEQGKLFGADENRVFKIRRYAPEYPGLAGKDLTPGPTLIEAIPPRPTLTGAQPADRSPNIGIDPDFVWDAVSDADSYRLQISTSPAFETPEIDRGGISDTAFSPSSPLANGEMYYWRVRSTNEYGAGRYSETITFTTLLDVVTLVQPEDGANDVLAYTEFLWNPLNGAESYHLQVGDDPTFTVVVLDTTSTETMLVPSVPLAYSTMYHWRVRGLLDTDPGPWSDAGSFTIAVGTASEGLAHDVPDRPDLKPNFPNPFHTSTTFEYELSVSAHVTVTVFDLLGNEIEILHNRRQSAGRHTVILRADSYPSGVYLVRFETGEFSDVIRMVVAK